MNNQRDHARNHLYLILALVGLVTVKIFHRSRKKQSEGIAQLTFRIA
jgi:hypothetical protein